MAPTSSKKDLGCHSAGHCWKSAGFFLLPRGLLLCACVAPFPVRGFWKFLHFLYSFLILFNFALFSFYLSSLIPIRSTNDPSKIYYYHRSRHRTSLFNNIWEIKKNLGIDPILKLEIVKTVVNIKRGNKYYHLWKEEKLVKASYNNPNTLFNQRSEILNFWRQEKLATW